MYSEIGSEFWLENEPLLLSSERSNHYVLSGRTAIDLIVRDILQKKDAKTVYMPAWCCDSMLAPFLANGFHVDLYDMSLEPQLTYHIDLNKNVDVFYVCNYFGYDDIIDNQMIVNYKSQGTTIIYDRTHSFFNNNDVASADYSFASIRKWMGVVCGAEMNGVEAKALKSYPFLDGKLRAMQLKKDYLAGNQEIEKQTFLNLFADFGHHLEYDYQDYAMDELSYTIYKKTNKEELKQKRRENANYLHEHMTLRTLAPLTDDCCPLFVPVFFESKEKRNAVRRKLIENQIYCPIHWSKNQLVDAEMKVNEIYDTELSLICDQRYGIEEMKKLIAIL